MTRSYDEYAAKYARYRPLATGRTKNNYQAKGMNETIADLNDVGPSRYSFARHNLCYRPLVSGKKDPLKGCEPLGPWPSACAVIATNP